MFIDSIPDLSKQVLQHRKKGMSERWLRLSLKGWKDPCWPLKAPLEHRSLREVGNFIASCRDSDDMIMETFPIYVLEFYARGQRSHEWLSCSAGQMETVPTVLGEQWLGPERWDSGHWTMFWVTPLNSHELTPCHLKIQTTCGVIDKIHVPNFKFWVLNFGLWVLTKDGSLS